MHVASLTEALLSWSETDEWASPATRRGPAVNVITVSRYSPYGKDLFPSHRLFKIVGLASKDENLDLVFS